MTSIPKVSVIIPFYNRERHIERCIRSLLSQTIDKVEYEIILINDGSTDNSLRAIEPYRDDIILIENKENKGLPYSLNRGIVSSKGQYIVRVDSDDYVSSRYIDLLLYYLSCNSHCHAVACDYLLVTDEEEIINRKNCFHHPIGCGIMFRKDALINLGLYNIGLKIDEDVELMERFLETYKIERLALALYRYRMHDDNLTGDRALQ